MLKNKNTIRVSEFEKLYYEQNKPFKKKHWEALSNYLEAANKKEGKRIEYFRILSKGIQFTNYVGVIQAGNLTIEILPKIDRQSIAIAANLSVNDLEDRESEQKQCWHNVLLQMLKECRLLQVNHVDYANLNLKNNSILEIYLELFLEQTQKLLREGLVKKYAKVEGISMSMKGQLLFSKNIFQNLLHRERFHVQYIEYNRTNVFNQLLYKTLWLIPLLINNPKLSDKTNRLILDFPEMPDIKVTSATFEKLIFNRKTERYKETLLISKMLLLNYRPDITGGQENIIAILFDMNALWEEFIYRRLKKEEIESNIVVQRQQSANFWKTDRMHRPKTIRPDIVIRKENKAIIIDTKWKIVNDLIPADDDLKQMFAYNLFWNCDRSILLYPARNSESSKGDYHDFRKKDQYYTQCAVETINIFDNEQKLDKNLGKRILNLL